jgi:hypothetical protein
MIFVDRAIYRIIWTYNPDIILITDKRWLVGVHIHVHIHVGDLCYAIHSRALPFSMGSYRVQPRISATTQKDAVYAVYEGCLRKWFFSGVRRGHARILTLSSTRPQSELSKCARRAEGSVSAPGRKSLERLWAAILQRQSWLEPCKPCNSKQQLQVQNPVGVRSIDVL